MSKHTPGPWRMNGPTGPNMQSYSQPFCIAGTGDEACTLIAGCFGDTKGGIDAAEANARLISAATDLLEALVALYESIDSCVELTPDVLRQARAAIKKARGEE